MAAKRLRVMLVCSPGGHLQQMLALRPSWDGLERVWVTLDGPEVGQLLSGEEVVIAHGPTNRSLSRLLRNLVLAFKLLRASRPAVVLSTGAGVAVPFFVVAKLCGVRTVYVESLTRIDGLSLSGRLVYPLADRFFVQWPSTSGRRRARYVGSVL
ncbi:MAG TPA: PssD/Cps14F family polysaccharide biosynthesis glycosyltransferase [Solirubrobacterales bacterium]|nr:PssD/Cps14F family polysaccharide biosynthesis glycosyltransferase [Solirubrobacterales bacterium]